MLKTSKLTLALLLATSAGSLGFFRQEVASGAASEPAAKPSRNAADRNERPGSAVAADVTFRNLDPKTEQRMLELANQSRSKFGAPPLTIDSGLSRAARLHAEAMVSAGRLSHQFGGEPSLPQRLASTSTLLLDQSGENVALDHDAAAAHQHLMLSPHHRENLLNPAYNVVGLGVVRSGDRLYIVQDFGHALPNYSSAEAKDLVAKSVVRLRSQSHQPKLQRRELAAADDAACSMAHVDRLGTSPVHQLAEQYTILTYTTLQPQALPATANQAVASRDLRSFAVGTCYSRTATYPNGVYWVVVSLH